MKSVFGFRVRLGNPDLDFENLNPDFPIERTLRICLQLFLARKERVLCTQWQGTECMIDDSMMGLVSSNDQNDIPHCRSLLEKKVETKNRERL